MTSVSSAPEGRVITRSDGWQVLLEGVIVDRRASIAGAQDRWRDNLQRDYAPFEDGTTPRSA